MVRYLHKLKAKRGFTLVELIVVIAVIGILATSIFVGLDDKQKTAESYQSNAQDFFMVLQAEMTRLQTYDGPLTMTLNKVYTDGAKIAQLGSNKNYGGMMYYPALGGNYPFKQAGAPGATANFQETTPADNTKYDLYIKIRSESGVLKYVRYDETLSGLISQNELNTTSKSELCSILLKDLKEKMDFKGGYYLAKVSYNVPKALPSEIDPVSGKLPPSYYYTIPIKVEWTAYSKNDFSEDGLQFGSRNQVLANGNICGVFAGAAAGSLGSAGTSFS